ncbi:MAG: DMT family transporter [Paracoccaceae bacterium]
MPVNTNNSQAGTGSAIVMMVLTIFFFSIMDTGVKSLAPKIGVLPTLWVRYFGQMVLVLILVAPRLRSVVRTNYPKLQLLRSLLLMVTAAFFFLGLTLMKITEATALMALNPVLIALGAAVFLGEHLGARRLMGIAVALVGALIIIRPGSGVFSIAALAPLAAAVCYSAYALVTRKVGPNEDVWTSLFYTGLVGTVILTCVVPFYWVPPEGIAWLLMIQIALAGTIGQLCLIRAFSSGEAAMLAPYAYTGLIFATFWGAVFFQEWPDFWTTSGALVIAGSGIYVWHRETYRKAR